MTRLSTCKGCGKKITKEEKYTHSNKSYCKECYDKIIKQHNEYKSLIDSICLYFKIDKPTGLILKQVKDYVNNLGYSYGGIKYTLYYITAILQQDLDLQYGIGLVKFKYSEAEDYYSNQISIQNSVKNIELKPPKVIKVPNKENKRKPIVFDLDEICEESEE